MENLIQFLADNRPLLIGALVALMLIGLLIVLRRGSHPSSKQPHFLGRRCEFEDLHPTGLSLLIWLWAESGPIKALIFLLTVGAGILALTVSAVLLQNIGMFVGSLALFGYYLASITYVKTATWLTLTVGGGRLKTTMIEGVRLVPRWLMKYVAYSAVQDPINVEGHADLADGSIQRYKGTISVIPDRHVVDAHDRPRYPEAVEILKTETGLPDRFKQAIEIVMSWCKGDDLLKRDEAVKFALSAIMRLRIPPHMDPNADLSEGIIAFYDKNKADVAKLLHDEPTQNTTDVELQFAVRTIETGVTFDPDMDLVPAQQGVRKAQLFREAQLALEKPEKPDGEPRMSPAESRQTMKVVSGAYKGTIVETGSGSAGGSAADPLGVIAGMSMLASALKGEAPKPDSYKDRSEKPKSGT